VSAPTDQITIDLDEVERKAAEVAAETPRDEPIGDPAPPKKEAAPEVSPEDGLEKLKKQLADEKTRAETERAARIAAENEAQEARAAEAKAKGHAQGTQLDLVKQAISTATQNIDILKKNLAAALAENNYEEAASIQYSMSENASNLSALKQAQKHLESAPKPTVQPRTDPVERFASEIASNGFPRSAAWVRKHGEFITDPAKHRKMIAAHELALADGIQADTDEYFASIEDTLKLKAAPREEVRLHDEDPTAEAAATPSAKQGRQSAPASAPVARSGNGTNGTSNGARQRTMTLTPEEREAARISGVTDEEYAMNKLAISKERLN
jgi:hypothetical protein